MYKKHIIGKFGEDYTCKYLEKNGYQIMDRNFSCRQGEIDIIAKDFNKKEIVFIEVKTRTNYLYGAPSDAVNGSKQNHLRKSIEYYIYKKRLEGYFVRVDVIEVYCIKGKVKVNHIKQIFG